MTTIFVTFELIKQSKLDIYSLHTMQHNLTKRTCDQLLSLARDTLYGTYSRRAYSIIRYASCMRLARVKMNTQ